MTVNKKKPQYRKCSPPIIVIKTRPEKPLIYSWIGWLTT